MILRVSILTFLVLVSTAIHVQAQLAVSEPQAVAVLTQALNASGTGPVRSFTAEGTITFFWAGDAVKAPATIRARGNSQFRLDASLQNGTRSVALDGASGARKDADGSLTEIPLHNRLSMGGSSFPYLSVVAVLSDPTFTVSYVGLELSGTRQLHHVRVSKNIPTEQDPTGVIAKLYLTDYFVDSATNLLAKVADVTHPIETFTREFAREVEYENYSVIGGVAVPTLVRERIDGQTTWELVVTSAAFNTSLVDADFSLR